MPDPISIKPSDSTLNQYFNSTGVSSKILNFWNSSTALTFWKEMNHRIRYQISEKMLIIYVLS